MFYCEGKYCSRRAKCAYNMPDMTGRLQQWLDMSSQGSGRYWTDEDGNPRCEVEHWCGDGSVDYKYFVPICFEPKEVAHESSTDQVEA